MNPRKPYRTDLSDARWALVDPILIRWREQRAGLGISQPLHDLREIVNAILYVNRTGMAWEYLVPLQNWHRCCDLRFGRMGWMRQDRGSCASGCPT